MKGPPEPAPAAGSAAHPVGQAARAVRRGRAPRLLAAARRRPGSDGSLKCSDVGENRLICSVIWMLFVYDSGILGSFAIGFTHPHANRRTLLSLKQW